jgi:hyaluronate lyase
VAAGSDFLSFRISSSGSGDDRYSTSNDVREFQPELVILRSPDQAQEIAPTDDAYVRGGSFASTNFGADGSLISKGSSSSGYRREIFMKFTLSGAGNFSSAKLVLYPTSVQASTVVDRLDEVTSDAWSEGSVTWNTKPPATGSYLASWSAVVGTELMIDITALAQAARSGDGVLSLRISSNVDRQTAYGSKENTNATVRPFLLLEP